MALEPVSAKTALGQGAAVRRFPTGRILRYSAAAVLAALALFRAGQFFLVEREFMRVPFHGDESMHLAQSDFFDLFFLEHRWHHPRWFEWPWGYDEPRVGYYLMGWQLYANGLPRPPCRMYDFGKSPQTNRAEGAYPPLAELVAVRRLMGWLTFAAVAGAALLGLLLNRPLAGSIAANLLVSNPLFIYAMPRAMLEAPLICGCTVSLVLAAWTMRVLRGPSTDSPWRAYLSGALSGIAIGLTIAAKPLGALVAFAFAASCFLLWFEPAMRRRDVRGRPVTVVAIAAIICVLIFVYSNPLLFSYPAGRPTAAPGMIGGIEMILNRESAREHLQREVNPGAIQGRIDGLRHVVAQSLVRTHPPMLLDPPPDGSYPPVFDGKPRGEGFGNGFATLGPLGGLPLDAVLFVLGTLVLVGQAFRCFARTGRVDGGVLWIIWAMMAGAGTALWLPLDWDRYYLLFICAAQFVIAAGLAAPFEGWVSPRVFASADTRPAATSGR